MATRFALCFDNNAKDYAPMNAARFGGLLSA